MRLFTAKSMSTYARICFAPKPTNPCLSFSLTLRSLNSSSPMRFVSSGNTLRESNMTKDGLTGADEVSKKELKENMERFYKGDAEAIPSIFEAILKRKLAGTTDESDDEFINEFSSKPKPNDGSDEDSSDEDGSEEECGSD